MDVLVKVRSDATSSGKPTRMYRGEPAKRHGNPVIGFTGRELWVRSVYTPFPPSSKLTLRNSLGQPFYWTTGSGLTHALVRSTRPLEPGAG